MASASVVEVEVEIEVEVGIELVVEIGVEVDGTACPDVVPVEPRAAVLFAVPEDRVIAARGGRVVVVA